jgi:hypothetical protein
MLFYDVVIPTFRRFDKLERFYESFRRVNDRWGLFLYLYFDNNDKETELRFIQKYGLGLDSFEHVTLQKQYRAFGIWNSFLKNKGSGTRNGGMFYLCDDIELFTDTFSVAINILENKFDGDGVIGLNQENIQRVRGMKGFSKSGMGLIGYKFAERFPDRQCFCPDYVSFKADTELGDFAASLGKFEFAEGAKITHHHPRFNKDRDDDETHHIVRDKEADLDEIIGTQRKERGFLWGKTFDRVAEGRWNHV